jgi:glycosyltransferase involved in cell wall biosynthesis
MDDNVETYLGLGALGRTIAGLYIRRIYVPQFDYHLANSHYTANELGRQARKHRRSVGVLPMGVEIDRFGPFRRSDSARRALMLRVDGAASTRVLVYAGRLAPEKNLGLLPATLQRLIDAAEGDGDYRLIIVGDGPLAGELQRTFGGRLRNFVRFWQHRDREALADLLANADAFVHRTRARRSASLHSSRWLLACPWSCRTPAASPRTRRKTRRGPRTPIRSRLRGAFVTSSPTPPSGRRR